MNNEFIYQEILEHRKIYKKTLPELNFKLRSLLNKVSKFFITEVKMLLS